MQPLIKQIRDLEEISAQLEIDIVHRKELLSSLGEYTNQFIESLPTALSFIDKDVNKGNLKISNQPGNIAEILKVFNQEVAESGIKAASGGHVGYIPGGGIYAAALGDFLAAVSNEYAGVAYASPGAVAIENEVLNWLKEVFSFPKSAVGNLASGGSVSNLIALTAARDKFGVKNEKVTKSVIYLSTQAHHCIQKSLRIIGLEDVIIRYVDLDADFKINPQDLEFKIQADRAAGLHPFLVIASAGTTDVGAIDPLDEMAAIAKTNNLWFHVDAAYGGFFVLTSKKELFNGIEKADSLVVDPHKGMFLPYGIGAVLIKDANAVLHANRYAANYMQDAVLEDLAIDPANVSPELTKHFRGLRFWLPLRLHGIEPFVACLEEKLLLTQYFREKLVELGFEVGPVPDLSVSYFWYPAESKTNDFNKQLMQHIHEDGSVFLSSTLLKDKFVIRMAILSFRTKLATINRAIEMIKRCLEKTKEQMAG
ncbi:MAG: aminotransferase class V-fold PLP-dependent enzyme [Chitinophagaceae bacterium]|nr:aminotransferase class V-fold PLP-dependent enzyme [Bacteroidota bacterium]MCC6258904.1 aminotransferase class V-fold PLP-dependent enzyme [Chitinophagaceae bacterium]MCW5916856.1 aminotransferase class V-fold PLP-dependent enzyme [Ferruginibacter sp.]